MLRIAILSVVAVLAGCASTSSHTLGYQASTTIAKAPVASAPIGLGNVVDARQEKDPRWFGAIRGGYGNALKIMTADRPVGEVVKTALAKALEARGFTVTPGNQLSVRIVRLDCDQYVRREANVDIEVTVADSAGLTKFARRYTTSRVEGSMMNFSSGIFGSTEELRLVMERALGETVDKALDDASLRAALQA